MKTWLAWLSPLFLAVACGPPTPEIRVVLVEDASMPCLGAKHIKIQVDMPQGNYQFDEFAHNGTFFNLDDKSCNILTDFTYDRLALSPAARVDVSIQDSSTGFAQNHILALGSTVTFAVNEDTPTTDYTITLSRRPEVSPGTAHLGPPADWNTIKQGIYHLTFQVYQEDEFGNIVNTVRSHSLAYDRRTFPEPWPIVISNLPVGQVGEVYKVRIDGLDASSQSIRFWIGEIFLDAAHVVAWANWST